MSTPFMHLSHRAQTPLRIPCKFPNCRRWFGNKSGLTQHVNRFHPDFLAFDPTSITPPSGPIPVDQDDAPNDPDDPQVDNGSIPPHVGTAGEEVSSQWHGRNAKLYHNYHTELTGMF